MPEGFAPDITELKICPPLARCGEAVLGSLARLGRIREFSAGGILFEEGGDSHSLFLLLSGWAETRRSTHFGDLRLGLIGPGEFLGEVSFLDAQPRTATAVTPGGARAVEWYPSALRPAMEMDLEMASSLLRAFWRSLSTQIRMCNDAMIEIMESGPAVDRPSTGGAQSVPLSEPTGRFFLKELRFSPEDLGRVAPKLRAHRYPSNGLIFAEGESGGAMYIVMEGKVRISRRLPALGEEALAILGRGEVFGEMAVIDDKPRSADAWAHTEGCAVLELDRHVIEDVLSSSSASFSPFLGLLDSLLCRKIRNMTELLVAWRIMAGFG